MGPRLRASALVTEADPQGQSRTEPARGRRFLLRRQVKGAEPREEKPRELGVPQKAGQQFTCAEALDQRLATIVREGD